MLTDRYDNPLDTQSIRARDHYITAVDRILGAEPDMGAAFDAAIAADPDFALAHVGRARARQLSGDPAGARAAIAHARTLAPNLPDQQASHINAMGLMIEGKIKDAYPAIRTHVVDYPRDAIIAQTCTSVFGLIGFSGLPGREAELLAYTTALLPHYGDDWWMLSQQAFSLCETGQIDRAAAMIDASLVINPRNAHAAHVRSHVDYEAGDVGAGAVYLQDWLQNYDRTGLLHGHLSWHVALWSLEQGDTKAMWQIIDADVKPGASKGLPINILTDSASILYRAELAGEAVPPERWHTVSEYAKQFFPKPGIGFVDIHAALAHAMSGETQALEKIITNPVGAAADLVREFSSAYRAIATQNWAQATAHLTTYMGDNARIGGSRAQRDLLVHTLMGTLLKQDRGDEARRLLAIERPTQAGTRPVAGL